MSQVEQDTGWLYSGTGRGPELRWAFSTDAPLVDLALARETAEVLAGDAAGGLYLLDRRGRKVAVTGGYQNLSSVAFSDAGAVAALAVDEVRLFRIDRRFDVVWTADMPDVILAIAVDPFGEHIAASLANGKTYVLDSQKKSVGRIETDRPLCRLAFQAIQPALIAAAEYGLFCSHRLDGTPNWREQLWSNVGDLSATGDGENVYLASYSHGIQAFDGDGAHRGSYVVEGSPARVASSFAPRRLAATTTEKHFYWLDSNGEMLWSSNTPEDVLCLRCDPLGTGVVCGLGTHRILSLGWQ